MGFNFGSLLSFGGMIAGGIIGAIVSGGNPAGIMLGASIGGSLGGIASSIFFPERYDLNLPPPPQPSENRVQISTYGASIPIVYGSGRMAGNIIYMQDVQEDVDRSKHRQDGQRYYEMVKQYTSTIAVAFCEGPVIGFGRIWINNKVFVDFRDPDGPYYPTGSTSLATGNLDTSIARSNLSFSMYFGTEDQTADSTLSTLLGATEVPAYKGICYIVFIDFPVGEYSGVPNIEIELSEAEDIYEESPSLNPTYAWNNIDFSSFSQTDTPDYITIVSATSGTISQPAMYGNWVYADKNLALSGDFKIRFKIIFSAFSNIGFGNEEAAPLKLKFGEFGSYIFAFVIHLDDNSPLSYYMGLSLTKASCQNYTSLATRYVEIIKTTSTTRLDVSIYTDEDFSSLEFTDYAVNAAFANDLYSLRIFDNYNCGYSGYGYTMQNLKYMDI